MPYCRCRIETDSSCQRQSMEVMARSINVIILLAMLFNGNFAGIGLLANSSQSNSNHNTITTLLQQQSSLSASSLHASNPPYPLNGWRPPSLVNVVRERCVARLTVLRVEMDLQSFGGVVNPCEIQANREHVNTTITINVFIICYQCNRIRM